MATVLLHYAGQTGGWGSDSQKDYVAVWRVTGADPQDGPDTILRLSAPLVNGGTPVPFATILGSGYAIGNDNEPAAKCRRLTPAREGDGRENWLVTGQYSTKEPEGGKDDSGTPSGDPTQWRPEVSVGKVLKQKPVEKAILRTNLPGLHNIGDEILPMNSAGEPFFPPLEKTVSLDVISVSKIYTEYPAVAEVVRDAINSGAFFITAGGLNRFIPQYCGKVTGCGASWSRINGANYWEVRWEITVDPDGWRVQIADRGFCARAIAGDPDGRGGSISAGQIVAGVPQVRRLKDKDGNDTPVPILLDGAGQPLSPTAATKYITYSVDREADLTTTGL